MATFFVAALCVLVLQVMIVSDSSGIAFGGLESKPLHLDQLTPDLLTTLKLEASPAPFDIGLFGNSRSVAVGRSEVPVQHCTFFNYSVPGSSFRSSVAILEELSRQKRAPRTAIVSLDHLELRMMGAPDHLPLTLLMKSAVSDAVATARHPASAVRAIWRHLRAVWTKTRRLLSSRFLQASLRRKSAGIEQASGSYRTDGSRMEKQALAQPKIHPFPKNSGSSIDEVVFIRDLERLARLQSTGSGVTRIIIYESPVQSEHGARFAEKPSVSARRLRAVAREVCGRTGLECHLGGLIEQESFSGASWADATHPPSSALGQWYAALLSAGSSCESGRT